MPQVTSVSVTGEPVVLIAEVAGPRRRRAGEHRNGARRHSHQQFVEAETAGPFDFV